MPEHWERLALDPMLARDTLASIFRTRPRTEWLQILQDHGAPCAPVGAREAWFAGDAVAQGGLRQGAAYEAVDDCRHDLTAWVDYLKRRAGSRIGLVGHSLGAVKCLYALAREPGLSVACVVALSPPRLSHAAVPYLNEPWYC